MDVFYAYSYGSAAWLAVQAAPLLASPTMITALLSPEVRDSSDLEEYFIRFLGITMIFFAILSVLLTGSVPLQSTLADTTNGTAGATTDPTDPKAPYALPALVITMSYHVAIAFFSYARYLSLARFPFMINALVHGGLAGIGLWCVLFATTNGRISRKTGADGHKAKFPYKKKGL